MIIAFIQYVPLIVACMIGTLFAYRKQSIFCRMVACFGWIFMGLAGAMIGPPPLMVQLVGGHVLTENLGTLYSVVLAILVFAFGCGGIVRGRAGLYGVSLSMFLLVTLMCFCCGTLLLIALMAVLGWYESLASATFGVIKGEHAFLLPILGLAGAYVGYRCVQRMKRNWISGTNPSPAREV